ncbi:hypothetical protein [Candidatus Albibeggiatoa sp. nov. BB20]|uniref:hypothetical protein n=1 Tax=Candidatus Albibeggiatoa sp. nov. BB20 TaxID=3162723 RepID=UPI0033655425
MLIDDAYIYLHIANNILDVGTAQYYPIVNNDSLLASSPLRMLILVPATALARIFTSNDYSFFTSQLTFVFSGLLTALLFLPWFWGKWQWFWAGMLFNGIMSVATLVTVWQMEGALLFWCIYTLAWLAVHKPLSAQVIRQIGYVSGLLLFSRPEYGFVTLLITYISLASSKHRWTWLLAYTRPLLIIAVVWILLAALLQVWFIPTSYLSKIMTGKLDFFSADFGDLLVDNISFYFFYNLLILTEESRRYITVMIIAVLGIYGVLLSRQHRFYLLYCIGFVLLTALLYHSPGNYLWYNENYFIAITTISFFVMMQTLLQQQKHYFLTGMSFILTMLLTVSGTSHRFFHIPVSYIEKNHIYENIAKHHQGHGLFKFPDLSITYISMMEIGVVSYLAGPTIWLDDKGGLAQAGTLEGTQQSSLAIFYPKRLLINGMPEIQTLCQRDQIEPCLLHDTWAMQSENPEKYVAYYFPQYKIGLNPKALAFMP